MLFGLLNYSNSAGQVRLSAKALCREVRLKNCLSSYHAIGPYALPPNFWNANTGTVFIDLTDLASVWVGLCHVIRGQVGRLSVSPTGANYTLDVCTSEPAWTEVSTVWHMPVTLADLQPSDPGLHPCKDEYVLYFMTVGLIICECKLHRPS